jgi:predicted phage terminase large subunit-like protein
MRPGMKWGWWVADVAVHLEAFYYDLVAGRRPKLALMAPPQHGKSWAATDLISWLAGKDPNMKIIFASYSDELGVRTNLDLQRIIRSPRYAAVFGRTRIGLPGWQCNSSLIEFVDYAGSFRNTTVYGAVNGLELNLGVIDDPVKGRQEANSKLIRDTTWSWFTDDFLGRFADNAGLLVIMTRWHIDDMLGRAIEQLPGFKVLRYPALAEEDEPHREKGQALFPILKPLDFLMWRKDVLTQASWEALYQQNPIIVGGGELPIEKLKTIQIWERSKVVASVRYWDKAASDDSESGAFTAGCLMHKLVDGRIIIEDMERGRWSVLDREARIKRCAENDGKNCKNYQVWIEQEPGSGGKESAEHTIRNLAGYRVYPDKVTGSKKVRAEPFAAQVQNGNVWLVAGHWVHNFLDECEAWPNAKFKDQVDAAAGAFNKLVASTSYNTNYREWAY